MNFRKRLRALERRLVPPPGLSKPMLIKQYVGARLDSEGRCLGPNLDFTKAETGGQVFERGATETLKAFEERVLGQVVMGEFAGTATFRSGDVGPQAA